LNTATGVAGALGLAVFVSALAVVYTKHMDRKLFIELQSLERDRDTMQVEWGQLLLEQSTWATHGRIEKVARKQLDLYAPPVDAIVLIEP
jgi:cell division protein FtsL